MANSLQKSINWARIFIRMAPLVGVGGINNEPALTIGDWVRQFILAPPFAWRWNRGTTSFTTVAGTQDYSKALTDFGWLEKATVGNGSQIFELSPKMNLGEEVVQNLPVFLAARLDTGSSVSFRLQPVPDTVYTVNISYQKAAPSFNALADTWAPIPDYLSFLYNQGVLAKAYEYLVDDRFPIAMQTFMRQVIAANAGLNDTQVNIFLSETLDTARDQSADLGHSQSGRVGRGGFQG